jgi:hypothetical protein
MVVTAGPSTMGAQLEVVLEEAQRHLSAYRGVGLRVLD